MKTDIITEFNLPKYTKGKSFAEASKAIEAKFKGRNDKASLETKSELLERLSQAQEYLKQQMEPSNEMADGGFANTQLGVGFQEGATGEEFAGSMGTGIGMLTTGVDLANTAFGKTGIDTSGATAPIETQSRGAGAFSGAMKGASAGMALGPLGAAGGAVLGGVAGLLGAGKAKRDVLKAEGNFDLKQSNQYRPNDYAFGGNMTDPVKKGKKTVTQRKATDEEIAGSTYQNSPDSMFNEYGLRKLGASVNDTTYSNLPKLNLGKYADVNYFNPVQDAGGTYTLNNTKNNPANIDLYKTQTDAIKKLNPGLDFSREGFTPLINQKAMGGYQNKYSGLTRKSSYLDKPTIEQNNEGVYMDANKLGLNPDGFEAYQKANPMGTYQAPKTQAGQFIDKAGNFLNKNGSDLLRLAPIIGNLTNKIEKPVTERGSRIDSVYRPQLFDEQRLINQVNQNNVNSGLKEASGGDAGALSTNLLAAHLNKNKALSDGYFKASEVNRGEDKYKFQTGRQKDMFNAQQNERYIERKAQDEGAYNTAKQAQRSALFEDIGAIGKEASYKKLVKEMFNYRWDGTYVKDKNGKIVKNSKGKPMNKKEFESIKNNINE